MSINFDNLLYCSVYGSTMALPQQSGSTTISGVLDAGGSYNYNIYVEFGRAFGALPDPPAIYIPNSTATILLNSPTSPNDSTRWYKVGNEPRPFILGSSAGNLNLTISSIKNTSTASAPTQYIVTMTAFNPYDVTATITTTVINYIAYGFANS